MIKNLIRTFLVWRFALFIPVICGFHFLNYGSSVPFFEVSYYHHNLNIFFDNYLFKVWTNFDGVHYFNIAVDGYINQARFFPLLPIILYLISFGGTWTNLSLFLAVILPNIIFIAFIFMYQKLIKLDFADKVFNDSLLYLILFPTAFFLISFYTEGLFLLLLISSLYFARKNNWKAAIGCAFLLCATRIVGFFIIPALLYELYLQNKKITNKNILKYLTVAVIPALSLLAFSVFNYLKWGNWLYFLTNHTELGNNRTASALVFPLQTVYRYFKIFLTIPYTQFEFWIAILELSSFIFGCVFLFIAWKKKIRTSYLIFGVPAFLLPSLSGTFSGLPRYILIIFPIFIAMALSIPEKFKKPFLVVSSTLLFILLMFFTKAYFVA